MIFVLICLLVVVPAHAFYGDYGGAKMPEYGEGFDDAGKDDYKDRFDPSSLLDNKFDDESFDKHDDHNNYDEIMNEQKTHKKLKKKKKQERYSLDESVTRNSKSRTKYHSTEYDDIYDIDFDSNRKINYKSQTDQGFEDDYSDHTDETFQRKRKARDRVMTTERNDNNDYKSYSMQTKKRFSAVKSFKRKNKKRPEYVDNEVYTTGSKHKDKTSPKYVDDEIYTTDRRPTKRKQEKEDTEYQDYYDMKRVNNIKKKIPQLRRPKEDIDTATQLDMIRTVLILKQQEYTEDSTIYPFGTEYEAKYLTPTTPTILTITTTLTTTTTMTTTTPTEQIRITETASLKELSMAEKSRLSIMKKAQKKEFAKVEETKNPPVLMKVTQRDMNTVVMVEPAQRALPDVPGHENSEPNVEIFDDSPEIIRKVKNLMRQNFIKSARSLNDITDNWDDTVCDYIDVSLLTESSSCSLSVSWWTICYIILIYQLVNYLMVV